MLFKALKTILIDGAQMTSAYLLHKISRGVGNHLLQGTFLQFNSCYRLQPLTFMSCILAEAIREHGIGTYL